MPERNTFVRSMHDLGLSAWFGGSLMGVIGLNGAAETAENEKSSARIASSGWARWTPVNAAAIAAHLAGGAALLAANRSRIAQQRGVGASTLAKTALTGVALTATAYTRFLGKRIELAASEDPEKIEAANRSPISLEQARKQLSIAQWSVPVSTGALLVLNALHGEQQRPQQQWNGRLKKAASRVGW